MKSHQLENDGLKAEREELEEQFDAVKRINNDLVSAHRAATNYPPGAIQQVNRSATSVGLGADERGTTDSRREVKVEARSRSAKSKSRSRTCSSRKS